MSCFPIRGGFAWACTRKSFVFGGVGRFLLIAVSALTGIATHIVWDSFTHRFMWPVSHWAFLRVRIHVPVLGAIPLFRVLQHASTVAGVVVLCVFVTNWYRQTEPHIDRESAGLSASRRWFIVGSICLLAFVGGMVRSAMLIWFQGFDLDREDTVAVGVVTGIALTWWLLVAYAVVVRVRRRSVVRV